MKMAYRPTWPNNQWSNLLYASSFHLALGFRLGHEIKTYVRSGRNGILYSHELCVALLWLEASFDLKICVLLSFSYGLQKEDL